MPFGEKVQCYMCEKEESVMWHKSDKGVKCSECFEAMATLKNIIESTEDQEQTPSEETQTKSKRIIKNFRRYKTRQNSTSTPRQAANKSKSRRTAVFKRNVPYKSPSTRATFVTLQNCFLKGQLYSVGDIVSVRGTDGGLYYAQITGLMQDEYCEKSCSITWLIPTLNRSRFKRDGFDPIHFVLGPDDDLPRRLECFSFVMHCPSSYWEVNCPFPTRAPDRREGSYIWSRLHGSK